MLGVSVLFYRRETRRAAVAVVACCDNNHTRIVHVCRILPRCTRQTDSHSRRRARPVYSGLASFVLCTDACSRRQRAVSTW